ncbi:hypothetical protein [Sporosarcina sp. ITBMC105]
MNKSLKFFIITIVLIMTFNTSFNPIALANQFKSEDTPKTNVLEKKKQEIINNHLTGINTETVENSRELSPERKRIVDKALKNWNENLIYSDIIHDEKVIILKTDVKDTMVAITDYMVEVVEILGGNNFAVNGDINHFEVTVEDGEDQLISPDKNVEIQYFDGFLRSGVKPGPWTSKGSKWVNYEAQKNFDTYGTGALVTIISSLIAGFLSLHPAGAIAVGVASGWVASYVAAGKYPTGVGKAFLIWYRNGDNPLADKKIDSFDYVNYRGEWKFMGISNSYYVKCLACNVQ